MSVYLVAYLGVALACALAGIGSAVGVGIAAQASTGVMSVDPKKFGKLLLLSALPGTQGIYGFVIAFLLLGKIGAVDELTMMTAWKIFAAGLPIALAGLMSGIHQGKVCAGGAMMTNLSISIADNLRILGLPIPEDIADKSLAMLRSK